MWISTTQLEPLVAHLHPSRFTSPSTPDVTVFPFALENWSDGKRKKTSASGENKGSPLDQVQMVRAMMKQTLHPIFQSHNRRWHASRPLTILFFSFSLWQFPLFPFTMFPFFFFSFFFFWMFWNKKLLCLYERIINENNAFVDWSLLGKM